MRTLALCAGLLLASTAADAAQIEVDQQFQGGSICPYFATISIFGDIEPDDDKKFLNLTKNVRADCAIVDLASNGGNLVAGLNIGLRIKRYEWGTGVFVESICASVCGMMWLAGTPRSVQRGGNIGFHAAYFTQNGQPTPGGNALVGAYLRDLGLGFAAIRYLTETPPDQMEWLTPEKARKYGIKMKIIECVNVSDSGPSLFRQDYKCY